MRVDVANRLVQAGLVSQDEYNLAAAMADRDGGSVVRNLYRINAISEQSLLRFLSELFEVPALDLRSFPIDPTVTRMIPSEVARKFLIFPLRRQGRELTIAMENPSNFFAIDDIKFITGLEVNVTVAPEWLIEEMIARYYPSEPVTISGPKSAGTGDSPEPVPALHSQDRMPRKLVAFLCHASPDKRRVRDLYALLVSAGVDPWLDEKRLLPGQDWNREIGLAVKGSDVIIVCLSPASVTKDGYIQTEIRLALDAAAEKPEGAIFLVPVRLEECDVPQRIAYLHYADLFRDDGIGLLLSALRVRAQQIGAAIPLDGRSIG